ncbi:MAG: AI-2E family transporter, partial [Oscillospiraceae bacterium]|nr:AI-2E family transporter [Oscillospiraceae bacterium]
GKILDSSIIGMGCFIVMKIFDWEFAVLISVIIGVTNIIPFFGPFFGAVPSALLLLMAAPKQVIPFVVFIIILQQVDGNILGPKILGDSTGLSPFWVMFAIFVGGGLFGFAGMLLGVPVFAVIYAMFSDFVAHLLKKKRLSHRTVDYNTIDINNPPPSPIPAAQKETEPKAEAAKK